MNIFRKLKNRKLIKRFLELDYKRLVVEENGCLKRPCSECELLKRIDEYYSTCPHDEYCSEMWSIYKKLFSKEPIDKYTAKHKLRKVRKLWENYIASEKLF